MSNKPYDVALFVGRLQHIHVGHQSVIDSGLLVADRVLILLGSGQEVGSLKNPFGVITRENMIREIYPDEHQIIIGSIPDLTDSTIINREWAEHVLRVTKSHIRKIPDVLIMGVETSRQEWFRCHPDLEYALRTMSELVVSRQQHNISATIMREHLFRDEFDTWQQWTSPKLHKHYDRLRSELLNAPGYKDLVREHLHPLKGWSDKPALQL